MRSSTARPRRAGPTRPRLAPFILLALAWALPACVGAQRSTAPEPLQLPAEPPAPLPPGAAAAPPKVGLLLPLTGNAAGLGADFLDAAQLALFDVGETELELLPRDTGDSPIGARLAAQAALDAGAELLVGPLFGPSTSAVAPVAAARGVSVLSFSNDASVAGGSVWAIGFRPEEQVARVVDYAVSSGLRRHAALAPGDAYGSRSVAAWRAAVAAAGAEEVVSERYPADADDPAPAVRAVAGYGRTLAEGPDAGGTPIAGAAPLTASSPPAFDALLIADGGRRLRSVAQLLSYYDVSPRTTRLLGTLRWQEDESLYSEPAAQGAWLATWSPRSLDRFRQRFRSTYGRDPQPLAVLAYDTTALAALLGQGNGRYAVDRLTDRQGFAGASGLFRLRPDGLAEHGLAVVEVRSGSLRTVDPAPEQFADTAPVF